MLRDYVGSVYGTARRVNARIIEVIKGARLRLTLDDMGGLDVGVSFGQPNLPEIQAMIDLPQEIASMRRKRIVVIDEFREVDSLHGVSQIRAMKSMMQALWPGQVRKSR